MTKPYFSALFALLLLPSVLAVAETVTFPSGEITLHGVSASAGPYIGDQIAAAEKAGGLSAAAATMVRLNDQFAALAWLRKQSFVQSSRIALAGNSFGGVETVLGVERGGYCAGIDSAGGAQSWAQTPELQSLM